jgi:hypothetical protein
MKPQNPSECEKFDAVIGTLADLNSVAPKFFRPPQPENTLSIFRMIRSARWTPFADWVCC